MKLIGVQAGLGVQVFKEAEKEGIEMLSMMRHAVGNGSRNNYCVNLEDSISVSQWGVLVGLGLAKAGPVINDGRDMYFYVTVPGINLLSGF